MNYLVSVEESIKDILQTPIGSRVMLPEYGSKLYELIDKRVDDEFRALLSWYVIEAVQRWEKRVNIQEVILTSFDGYNFDLKLVLDNEQALIIRA